MKYSWSNSPILWKDSLAMGLAILAGIETFLGVSGISLDFVWGEYNRIIKLLLVFALFAIIVTVILYPNAE
ncbi:hypothetical protein FACS1894187_15930 [Synergistales bacterium]|nr:hypothetical protein FACS1894187_15930 [Synergistales bacterium]